MRGERLLRQMSLLAVLWMFNADGVSKLAEAKTLPNEKVDYSKDGISLAIVKQPADKSVKEGKGLALVCSATGNPKPRIKWKKNGRTITPDHNRIKIRVPNPDSKLLYTASRLRIRDAVPRDSGDYRCVAKNHLGVISSIKARVEVRRKNTPIKSGTCKPYSGSICSRYISNDGRVFIQHLKTQKQSEENIIRATSILTGYMHPSCKNSLVKALCYNLFPPCQSGRHPRPRLLCKDECEVLQARTCSKEFRYLRKRLGLLADDTVPNCSLLSSDAGGCLVIGNKTFPGRDKCQRNNDIPKAVIKPLNKNHPVCSKIGSGSSLTLPQMSRKVKIYNKEILKLIRNVKSEIHSGEMLLSSQSSELATYCFSAVLPLNNLVRDWNVYHKTPILPNLQRPHNITVPGLTISTLNSSVDTMLITLGSAEKYKVHEKVVLRNVAFFYRFQSGYGSFIAKGDYDLCGTVFKLTVETLSDGTVKLNGFSEAPLDVSTIESVFVSARPSSMLVNAFKKTNLFVLRLIRPVMEAYIIKDLIVKFSGQSYFGDGALPVTLEFFGGKLRRQDVLLAGITSPHLTMNQALKMFTGFTIPYLDFLRNSSNKSSVGITLSANTLDLSKTPYGRFEQQPLYLAFADTVPWGLSLVIRATIPAETQNNSHVCQLFQAVFGRGSEFTLKASTDWKDITLNWHFHNISKGAVTSFDNVEMKLKIDDASRAILRITPLPFMEFYVDGSFHSSNQRSESLPFSGQLTYEGHRSYLEGNFETQSEWRRAFGIEYLSMRNLRLGVSLPTDQSQKSSIRGEADLQLGVNCHATNGENHSKQHCVTGHLYLGFSDLSSDHFFYGTLSPVSLQKLLEVYNIQHKLPGAIATIGFPEGLQISVSRGAHDLSELGGPVLHPGFNLRGKMSVLGIETTGAISLLPKEFLIDAKITSHEGTAIVDEVTPLLSSSNNRELSPKLFLKARMDPVPFVKAHVDGYARLFGIFKEVRMLVTRDSLQLYLTTDVSKSFKIDVHITTNYSSNRNDTLFNAMIVFDNGLSKLTRLASKQVVAMLEQEMSELKLAKGEVQRLRRECIKTIKRDCSSCIGNNECARSLTSCLTDMGLKSPSNGSERKRDTKRASATTLDVCQQFTMERCLASETACYNVCRFISSKANKTCAAYDAAATAQRKLERGLRWVRQAEQFMYSELFQIHSISFKTNVTSASLEQLYMDTSLEVTIFGQKEKLEGLRMKFNEFVKLSSEIAKYAWDWYQKTQPQSKSKSRHPDNRPRSPSS